MNATVKTSRIIAEAIPVARHARGHFDAAVTKDSSDEHYRAFRECCAELRFAAKFVGIRTLDDTLTSHGCGVPFWL